MESSEMSRRYKIASDPSKATVCLICGCLFMGDPKDHCTKTDHKLFVRNQTLYCKTCSIEFTCDDFDDKTNDMLISVATGIAEWLSKQSNMAY